MEKVNIVMDGALAAVLKHEVPDTCRGGGKEWPRACGGTYHSG